MQLILPLLLQNLARTISRCLKIFLYFPGKILFSFPIVPRLLMNGRDLLRRAQRSLGKWINELWYMQTMEYYSVLKRNELSTLEKTPGNLNVYRSSFKQRVLVGCKAEKPRQ
ncbi:unnamed protein product [Nyctereutes procyonoides]|uniref:(raccoon dog) hypothetical protein n=1 Tax=Nyctereutes procyonoides TaxID=34880 RepID=A0A811ZY47_NYCPR|nr:unnamed protein product [Nyctereutes procyonoides]